jgi:heat shock protein HslJ
MIAVVGVALLALAGCAASPQGGSVEFPDVDELDGQWQLTAGTDTSGTFDLGDSTLTLEIDDNAASGNSGCNTFTGQIGGTADGISIGPLASTRMACSPESVMQLEARYLKALETVDTADLGDDALTLSLKDGELELTFAEAEDTDDDASAPLVGTTWALESVNNGDAVTTELGDASLVFGDDGSIHGSAGCRGFAGDYVTRSDGTITITHIEIDTADCPSDIAVQETAVFDVIGQGFRATIDDNRLTISRDGSAASLVYRPLEG